MVLWRLQIPQPTITGIILATLSGLCNGLFTTPMKLEARWKWENIWFIFIVVSCLIMPASMVFSVPGVSSIFDASAKSAITAAVLFGFAWGFGAICFGKSVDQLGVSVANTVVIGLSAALGSLVPLFMDKQMQMGRKELLLLAGILTLLVGVGFCGKAGTLRDGKKATGAARFPALLFAVIAGVMSAIFNIGYALALPIAATGKALGFSEFTGTNCIWLLMLAAGSVPNLVYCGLLMRRNRSLHLMGGASGRSFAISSLMGLLWGGSIFLYGAATPRLGSLGPSVGWPLSLAVGLLVANGMGVLLGEWKNVPVRAAAYMWTSLAVLLSAIALCGLSAGITA